MALKDQRRSIAPAGTVSAHLMAPEPAPKVAAAQSAQSVDAPVLHPDAPPSHAQRIKSINKYLQELKGIQLSNTISPQELEELLQAIRTQDDAAVKEQLAKLIADHKIERVENPLTSVSADIREDVARMEGKRSMYDLQAEEDAKAVVAALEAASVPVETIPKAPQQVEVKAAAPSHPSNEKPIVIAEIKLPDSAEDVRERLRKRAAAGLALLGLEVNKEQLAGLSDQALLDLNKQMALAFKDDSALHDFKAYCQKVELKLEPIPDVNGGYISAPITQMTSREREALSKAFSDATAKHERKPTPGFQINQISEPDQPAQTQEVAAAAESSRAAVLSVIPGDLADNLGLDLNKMVDSAVADAAATVAAQDNSPAPIPGKRGQSQVDANATPISQRPLASPTGQMSVPIAAAKAQGAAESAANEAEAEDPSPSPN